MGNVFLLQWTNDYFLETIVKGQVMDNAEGDMRKGSLQFRQPGYPPINTCYGP